MYLVTGGAGFIGSNLVEALIQKGERVRVFDDLSTGDLANLAAVKDHVEIIEGDLRDMAALRRAVEGVTHISHQAALRSVPRSVLRFSCRTRISGEEPTTWKSPKL